MKILALVLLCMMAGASAAEEMKVKVVGVRDGDTLVVKHESKTMVVRLNGIDCPEAGQPFSSLAKRLVENLAGGKTVTAQTYGKDKLGRTLADITLPNGRCLNTETVKARYCRWSRDRSDKQKACGKQEANASR